MAFTGTQVKAQIDPRLGNDTADSLFTAAQKLAAFNAAIAAAWPAIKSMRIDSSITLDADTFEYSPTAGAVGTDNYCTLEEGFADAAYVVPLSATQEPKIRLTSIRQRLSATTWTIIVPPHVTRIYDGNVLHLGYNARVPRITAMSDSIELPLDYLENYALWWLSTTASLDEPKFDADAFKEIVPEFRNYWQAARLANMRGYDLLMPRTYDYGTVSSYDPDSGRYLGSSGLG